MFKFSYAEKAKVQINFSELDEGDTFCHSLRPVSIFMKKNHYCRKREMEYQSIDLTSGSSMTTNPNACCYRLDLNAEVVVL